VKNIRITAAVLLFSSKADSSSLQVRRVRFKARLNDSDPS
jgi:hypothetical protein